MPRNCPTRPPVAKKHHLWEVIAPKPLHRKDFRSRRDKTMLAQCSEDFPNCCARFRIDDRTAHRHEDRLSPRRRRWLAPSISLCSSPPARPHNKMGRGACSRPARLGFFDCCRMYRNSVTLSIHFNLLGTFCRKVRRGIYFRLRFSWLFSDSSDPGATPSSASGSLGVLVAAFSTAALLASCPDRLTMLPSKMMRKATASPVSP